MFLRRLFGFDLQDAAVEVVARKIAHIRALEENAIQHELQYTRNVRDLVENFLIVQEQEIDVREELQKGLQDLNDHVARLEEHVP